MQHSSLLMTGREVCSELASQSLGSAKSFYAKTKLAIFVIVLFVEIVSNYIRFLRVGHYWQGRVCATASNNAMLVDCDWPCFGMRCKLS